MMTKALIILLMILSLAHAGEEINAVGESIYHMGDSDSRLTARSKAIALAKKDAIEKTGVNISQKTIMDGDEIIRDDTIVSNNGLITSKIISESFGLDEQGRQYISLKLSVTIEKEDEPKIEPDSNYENLMAEIKKLTNKIENLTEQKEVEASTTKIQKSRIEPVKESDSDHYCMIYEGEDILYDSCCRARGCPR